MVDTDKVAIASLAFTIAACVFTLLCLFCSLVVVVAALGLNDTLLARLHPPRPFADDSTELILLQAIHDAFPRDRTWSSPQATHLIQVIPKRVSKA
jgi:hypothetical protein